MKTFLILLLSFSPLSFAQSTDNNHEYIAINIGVDIKGIERSSENFKEASFELAASIRHIANNPKLQPEQLDHLNNILVKMSSITNNLNQGIEQLPLSIAASKEPILNTTTAIRAEIRALLIKTAITIILIFAAALFCVFWFILRPSKRMLVDTSKNLSNIAQALEKTALLVERTNEHYLNLDSPPPTENA